MAIHCDLDPNDFVLTNDIDPFAFKAKKTEERRKELLQIFLSSIVGGLDCIEDTTLIQLILTYNVVFEDKDMMLILRLDTGDIHHRRLYNSLLYALQQVAVILKSRVTAVSLRQMPMTDLRRISYRVADGFEQLYYVPVREDSLDVSTALSYSWRDRYNSMWPIISLLNREYQAL